MRITEHYPIYIDPTFQELEELANSNWDTVRISVIEDLDMLCIGSGYGNTHTSLAEACKKFFNLRRIWLINDSILWKCGNYAYLSTEGETDGNDFCDFSLFKQDQELQLRDLIQLSGLIPEEKRAKKRKEVIMSY